MIATEILPLRPRPAGVVVDAEGRVSWDAGEAIEHPGDHTTETIRRRNRHGPAGWRGGWRGGPTGPYLRPRSPSESLIGLMAVSNCERANRLGHAELAAVMLAIAHDPFPCDPDCPTYAATLARVEKAYLDQAEATLGGRPWAPQDGTLAAWLQMFDEAGLGEIRKHLVVRAGSGCNAPVDTYLRRAAEYHAERMCVKVAY